MANYFDKNKTYEDWQGNQIVAGQTLVLVRTEPMFSAMKMMIFDFKEQTSKQVGETIIPPKHIWELCGEFKVWEDKNGTLFYTLQEDDYKCHIQLSSLLWMNNAVVCIKGISDKEQDYYTNYFKN